MISAWVQENQLVLEQLPTEAKSNEITAIPELLARLDLQGAVVTIDAMGCQKTIAEKVVEQAGTISCRSKTTIPRCGRTWNCSSPRGCEPTVWEFGTNSPKT